MTKRNRVTNLQQYQQRSEELKQEGYVAVRPDAFISPQSDGYKVFSWNDYVHSMLLSEAGASASSSGGGSALGNRYLPSLHQVEAKASISRKM